MATARKIKATTRFGFTVPGMSDKDAKTVIGLLPDRLNALNDLALTLQPIHWNVVGPNFIAVRTMLDPQVDAVRLMVEERAERIATLGASPVAPPVRWRWRSAAGTTTTSDERTRSITWVVSMLCTAGRSRPTAAPSMRPRSRTRPARRC